MCITKQTVYVHTDMYVADVSEVWIPSVQTS